LKRQLRLMVFTVVMLVFSSAALANSGPVYWRGYPSSGIMSIEKDSPLIIKEENLVFDFSGCDYSDFSIKGKVTAAYEMLNPTNETQVVQMAFPFVGRLDNLSRDDLVIIVDDREWTYDLYAGEMVEGSGNPWEEEGKVNFDFASILNSLTNKTYQAENFATNEKGKLYLFEVRPTTEQRVNFAVDFCFEAEKTKVLTKGFNRYERNETQTRIAAWCSEPRRLEILVLGEDIEPVVNVFTDGELKERTELFYSHLSIREVELKPYLLELVNESTRAKGDDLLSETQLYNLYAASLDRCLGRNMGYGSEDDLFALENHQRIFTLVYTVEFPPRSTKKVSVRYRTAGTMDRRKTASPLYSYDYILNPAENWRGFERFKLKIITPEEAPYIVESSIALVKGENNVYTASLAGLPEEDLSFILYKKEKVRFYDKFFGEVQIVFRYLAPLFLCLLGVIILVIISVLLLKRKRRNGN
jgi:hypothetical protein